MTVRAVAAHTPPYSFQRLSVALGSAIFALAVVSPADAAPPCGPRALIVAQLADQYGESRRGMGLAGNAAIVEVYVSETASWTVAVTMPDGQTCLLASGEGWETLDDALPPAGDDL